MLKFVKYPSLTDKRRMAGSNVITEALKGDEKYYATEKLHGENASILVRADGTYGFAMRNEIIGNNEELTQAYGKSNYATLLDFYNKHEVFSKVQHLFSDTVTQINIYGEIHGKGVFHMEYETTNGQNTCFRVFNVFLISDATDQFMSLGYEAIETLFHGNTVPLLATGTLSELLSVKPSDKSVLGAQTSEGIVAQPYDGQNHKPGYGSFLAVKYKADIFEETKSFAPEIECSPLQAQVNSMSNKVRLESVLSKGIEISKANMGKIILAYREDITDELYDSLGEEYADVTKADVFELTKVLSREVFNLLSEHGYLK